MVAGRPLAMQFLNADATVTICHTKTAEEDILKFWVQEKSSHRFSLSDKWYGKKFSDLAFGRFAQYEPKNIDLRRRQFRMAEEPAFGLGIAQAIVAGKLANLATVLMRIHRKLHKI